MFANSKTSAESKINNFLFIAFILLLVGSMGWVINHNNETSAKQKKVMVAIQKTYDLDVKDGKTIQIHCKDRFVYALSPNDHTIPVYDCMVNKLLESATDSATIKEPKLGSSGNYQLVVAAINESGGPLQVVYSGYFSYNGHVFTKQ